MSEKDIEEFEKELSEMLQGPIRQISDEELTRRVRRAMERLPHDNPWRREAHEYLVGKEKEDKKP